METPDVKDPLSEVSVDECIILKWHYEEEMNQI